MGKRKKYKVGEIVEFNWAGATEKGEVLSVDNEGKHIIFDGKYTYPVQVDKIYKSIK